ncbi:MAG: hypothetical protein L6R41_008419 [Letrouitia leprolyta]|nr:MAG: hypothetical protein L6R41_008419 [Letrouitia leprolyta]
MAIQAGVRIALGTDLGVSSPAVQFNHGMNGGEFFYAVDAGMTPLEAIEAGTANGPETLGLQAPKSGILEVGYDADFIALSGNPLEDIKVLADPTKVTYVWKEGQLVKSPKKPVGVFVQATEAAIKPFDHDIIPMHDVGQRSPGADQSLRSYATSNFQWSQTDGYDTLHGAKHDEETGLIRPNRVDRADRAKVFYHRDILKRPFHGRRDDRFLDPKDGRPAPLVVQSTGRTQPGATWQRTSVQNISPWMFRLSCWAYEDPAFLRWLPACAVLTVVLLNPLPVTTVSRNNGFYEPLPYKDWQYPYDARNEYENAPLHENKNGKPRPSKRPLIGKIERFSEPDYLCLAEDMRRIKVSEWREKHGLDVALNYIMVSFTGVQFAAWRDNPEQDRMALHRIGQHAAREAGVKAYWVDFECLGTEDERELNAWRICDVVRGAFQLVIAIAGPINIAQDDDLPYNLLHDWGNRVWTLPELLLTPGHRDLSIYTVNRNLPSNSQIDQCLRNPPKQIALRSFARYWEDHELLGQLIDHFENSVILTPLELITTALKCLEVRHTTQHLPGDLSYSLMGLLRQRPNAQKTDSGFQAFARLSLANDSNMLLERLICLLPQSPYAPWYSFHDHWNASLWDIYPRTQVCGIGHNDTVILDGARAATIRWKKFKKVLVRGNDTLKRKLARLALSLCSIMFVVGVIFLIIGKNTSRIRGVPNSFSDRFIAIGAIVIVIPIIVILTSPVLIKWLYLGKVWSAQPWFFGIEGYMSLAEIEKHLFGANLGRLSWSTTSSSLSKHDSWDQEHYEDYCQGQDPSTYDDVKAKLLPQKQPPPSRNPQPYNSEGEAQQQQYQQQRVFTLVDTFTMTATLFEAVKPPVAVLACGEEGGMQRALLCSWDWTTNTLHREKVLRMETRAYWRMSPVGRVRLGWRTGAAAVGGT